MAKPKGFENVVSRGLDQLCKEDGEFEQFLRLGGVHESRGRRGLAMPHGFDEMEVDGESIQLQRRCGSRQQKPRQNKNSTLVLDSRVFETDLGAHAIRARF